MHNKVSKSLCNRCNSDRLKSPPRTIIYNVKEQNLENKKNALIHLGYDIKTHLVKVCGRSDVTAHTSVFRRVSCDSVYVYLVYDWNFEEKTNKHHSFFRSPACVVCCDLCNHSKRCLFLSFLFPTVHTLFRLQRWSAILQFIFSFILENW